MPLSLLSERGPVRAFFHPRFFLYSSLLLHTFSPTPVYKAFAHKLQRITRHTPFRSTEPYSSSVPPQCVCVFVWKGTFEQEHSRSHRGKKVEVEKQKREVERGEWGEGRLSDCCSQRRRKSQRAELWPAASLCHHTAFVERVDLERTFQRGREKRQRWQKKKIQKKNRQWEDISARGEGAQ